MKLIRLYRVAKLNGENVLYKDVYEVQEKPTYYLVMTGESRNFQVGKDNIMTFSVDSVERIGQEVASKIWCFDHQETEAQELLEDHMMNLMKKRKEMIEKELANLSSLIEVLPKTELVIKKLNI